MRQLLTKVGGEADRILLTHCKLQHVTQPDQSLLCLISTFICLLRELLKLKLVLVFGKRKAGESTFDLKDSDPGLLLLLCVPPATSEGILERERFCDAEDLHMLRILPLTQRDVLVFVPLMCCL